MRNATVGEKIKQLRQKNNMMQSELAEYLSVTNGAISNWENNRRLPSIEELKNICECFKVSLDFFADATSPYKVQSELIIPLEIEKQVVSYKPFLWDRNSMNQLFLFSGIVTFTVSGIFTGNLAVFFLFYGIFSMLLHLVHSLMNSERNSSMNKSIQIDMNWQVVYMHSDDEDQLAKRKQKTMIALISSAFIDVGFLGAFFYLLYQHDYLFVILIMIFYFLGLIFVNYYCFITLQNSKLFMPKISFTDVRKSFKYIIFDILLAFKVLNVFLIAVMVLFYMKSEQCLIVGRLTLLLAFIGFMLSYAVYVIFNRTCKGYQLTILDQNEKVVPIDQLKS